MNYICKNRHGIYYARFVIPTALREQFKNKREIRYSLKTDSRKQAIISCRRKRVEFDEIIENMTYTTGGGPGPVSPNMKEHNFVLLNPKEQSLITALKGTDV